jgi:ankyrin repeat protein
VIGETPISEAVTEGNLESMEVLLEFGADINAKDLVREATPLYDALRFHQPIAAKWLLEHGADWMAQTTDGVGIPEVALHYEFDPQRAPEHAAALEWIWNFLEEQGVDLVAAEQRSREIFQGNFHRIDHWVVPSP